jgi:hypothetical protein
VIFTGTTVISRGISFCVISIHIQDVSFLVFLSTAQSVTLLCSQCWDVLGVTDDIPTDSQACLEIGCCLLDLSHVLPVQWQRVHGKRLLVGVGRATLCGYCCRLTGTALTLAVVMQGRSRKELRSSGILRGVERLSHLQGSRSPRSIGFHDLKDGSNTLLRNVGEGLPLYAA